MNLSTRLRAATAIATVLVLASSAFSGAATPRPADRNSDRAYTGPNVDKSTALAQLKGEPLSTYVKTRPAQGKKIDFRANGTKAYRAELSALRNEFKQWLQANAPKARISGQYDISLNAVAVKLNGTTLATLRAAPQVKHVEYQGVYHKLDGSDPDLSLISAQAAWATSQVGGSANAGAGVKVAIVDSGIDDTHPCFDDAGYPTATQLGDHDFTNNKVIVAKVFHNKAGSRGYTPEAIDDHGTHVAGTVACNLDTPATVSGVDIPYDISGVAPAALLGNYNVFPSTVESARSEDILNALEAAYADGMDVANMSLGGGASGIQDLLTMAVDNLDRANMVVAVAAGNSGPGHFTVESPGSAARALTAGASTVPHFVGAPFTVDGATYGLAAGDFEVVETDLTAPLGVVVGGTSATGGLNTACSALPAGSLTGEIALISRGVCTFSQKIRNAQDAGAVAAVVVNNVAGDPTAMALGGIPNEPTIPAYMVGLAARAALMADDGKSATIDADLAYFATAHADIMAGFSSQGPTDVDFRVKPDVVAPGVNVLSSVPMSYCDSEVDPAGCFAFFQGTSMATPHLAGSAAVVRGAHPSWSAAQVRSAVVNTADEGVLTSFTDGTTVVTDPNITGSGRENLLSAVEAVVALGPVSVSFGAVPGGSGISKAARVTVTNLTGSSKTFSFATSGGGGGVSYAAGSSSMTLAAGASGTLAIWMTATKGATFGDHNGMLRVSASGSEVAHAVLYTFIK